MKAAAHAAAPAGVEFELKLQVPPTAQAAVTRAVATASAQRTRLAARYLDTPERHLAQAHAALRLRLEGRRWVQTLKCGSAHGLHRLEHNVALSAAQARAGADPARHAGTAAGQRLAELLPPGAVLQERFATDVQRLHRLHTVAAVPGAAGGRVELALDIGELRSGSAVWPLCELEIEHVAGPASAVIASATRWVRQHGLWLDVRSKAERGELLARGQRVSPAVKASPAALRPGWSPARAWAGVLANGLAQALPNASQIASGEFTPEHLHQLRVALRRLHSARRLFAGLVPELPAEAAQALDQAFRQLGGVRDQQVLQGDLGPQMAAAGGPPWPAGAPAADWPGVADAACPSPVDVVRSRALNQAWLHLLAVVHADDAAQPPTPDAGPARREDLAALRQRLRRWHRRARQDARAFAQADDEARHRLRKRLKRLRYGLEFCAGLLPAKVLKQQLAALAAVQLALGRYNDLVTALPRCRDAAAQDPRAWFAVGWLTAQRPQAMSEATQALAHWARLKPV
jgi:inorganic triphosphatase YgiF